MYERISITDKRPKGKSQSRIPQIYRKKDHSKSMNFPVDRILFLQRTAGNQAVQRLIKSGALQAKLRIGQPGDTYEQEADWVAEQVMRMREPQAVSNDTPFIHSIQRTCLGCEDEVLNRQPIEEDEEEELQAKATSSDIYKVNPHIEYHIQTMRGGGQPGDKYEQEADRVADTVMRMPELTAASGGSPHIQRNCAGSLLKRRKSFRRRHAVSLKYNLILNLTFIPLKEAASHYRKTTALSSSLS